MSDNLNGELRASEAIGGIQFPRVKLVVGAKGVDGGDVETSNPLPVVIPGGITITSAAVTVADGADVAQGSKADAAWVAGDGTVISLLKKIASAGGSAVSIADGADVAQGAKADAVASSDTGTFSLIALFKRLLQGITTLIAKDFATTAKQDTGNTSLASIDGKLTSGIPIAGPVEIVNDVGNPIPVNGTVSIANLDVALSTRLKAADTLTGVTTVGTVTAVTAITNALPAGANAIGKLAVNDGVDIGDVTINNAAGAAAVNIQDGGNSITVDATELTTLAAAVKAEDSAATSADKGFVNLALRQNAPTTDTDADGDYTFLKTDAQGRAWVNSDVLGEQLREMSYLQRLSLREAMEFRRQAAAMSGMFLPLPEIF